jgi:hypothetical protein
VIAIAVALFAAPAGAQRQLPAQRPQASGLSTVEIGCEWRGGSGWGIGGVSVWVVNTQAYPLPVGTQVRYFYSMPSSLGAKTQLLSFNTQLYAPLAPGAAMRPPEHTGYNTGPGAVFPRSCRAQASFRR